MGRAPAFFVVLLVGGCAIDLNGLGGSIDGAAPDRPRDGAADQTDSGPAPRLDGGSPTDAPGIADAAEPDDAGSALGWIGGTWPEVFRDEFDEGLAAWVVDANDGTGSDWTVRGGNLYADSPSSGADAVIDRSPDGNVGVAALLRVTPSTIARELHAGGLIVRASSIDFAENDFYFCGFDPVSGDVVLTRYDPTTRVSSGQGFMRLDGTNVASGISGVVLITLCAVGNRLTCVMPDLGVHLEATDDVFASGWSGIRSMAAETEVAWMALHTP